MSLLKVIVKIKEKDMLLAMFISTLPVLFGKLMFGQLDTLFFGLQDKTLNIFIGGFLAILFFFVLRKIEYAQGNKGGL